MLRKGFVHRCVCRQNHWSWRIIPVAGWRLKGDREGGAGEGMRVPSESVPFWFAVPEGEDGVWPNLLLPHGDVLQRAPEGEVPASGLHGGAEWQLQVRSPAMVPVQFGDRDAQVLCVRGWPQRCSAPISSMLGRICHSIRSVRFAS